MAAKLSETPRVKILQAGWGFGMSKSPGGLGACFQDLFQEILLKNDYMHQRWEELYIAAGLTKQRFLRCVAQGKAG